MPTTGDITQLLAASEGGDRRAAEELLPLVYEELRKHALARMSRESPGQTLQPTALVHEAWLRLVGGGGQRWQNRAHFFGAAAEAMRRILIEIARRKSRLRHGGDQARVNIADVDPAAAMPEEKLLLIDDALERLKTQDPEKARVVTLKYYGGLTNQQVAESLGVTERTVERHWAYARAWLFQSIRAEKS